MKHILLLGAAGKTGKLLTKMALDAGLFVTILVRNPVCIKIKHQYLEVIEGDVLNYLDIEKAVQGQDAVMSTLAKDYKSLEVLKLGTKKLIKAMEKEKVHRLITLSSIGAGSTKRTKGFLFRFALNITGRSYFFESLTEQENLLRESNLNFTIIQTGALTDIGQTGMVLKTMLPSQMKKTFLPGAKIAGRSQVASFMLSELLHPAFTKEIICIHN